MPPRATEMLPQKIFVHGFDQHVKAKVAPIQFHECMRDARGGQTSIAKQTRGHVLREITSVLAGIVQEEFAHAAVSLARHEFVESHRKARLLVQRPKAAHAFEMHGNVGKNVSPFFDRAADILPVLLLQGFELRAANLDLESSNSAIRE